MANGTTGKGTMTKGLISTVVASIALALSFAFAPAFAQNNYAGKQQALVEKATATLRNFSTAKEMQWFRENIDQAKGLVIFPSNLKGGFIIGGSGGSGVMIARTSNGGWSYPAFYTTGSFTFGLQFGGQVSELVLMVMTQKGVDAMLSPELKVGGDVSAVAGPVGAGAKGQTADIIAFARGKGLYGGLNIEGTVITTREKWNRKYYFSGVRTSDILVSGKASNAGANALRNAASNIPNY